MVGQVGGALAGLSAGEGKALATPAVRRLARDIGIDINRVPGSGIGGRVTEKDVRAFGQSGGAAAAEPAPDSEPAQPLPHRSRRLARRPTLPGSRCPRRLRRAGPRACPRRTSLRRSRRGPTRPACPSAACVARSPTASARAWTRRCTLR
ncbi:MAG: hypothetical protein HND58_08775 [Planctomycetota bacterium]|nr:MAG: hypothetical protein HND58_08775 [Planctomycetota bacterium]